MANINNTYGNGKLVGMITEKQIAMIERTMKELGQEFNREEFDKWNMQKASQFIEMLIARKQKVFANRPSENQLKMLRDMCECPSVELAYTQELCHVPEKWIIARNKLMDEAVIFNKLIDNPIVEMEIGTVFSQSDIDEVLDLLLDKGIIDTDTHHTIIWLEPVDQYLAYNNLLSRLNVVIDDANHVKRQKKVDTTMYAYKLQQLKERIANANKTIEEFEKNFDVTKLDKTEVGEFIEKYKLEYYEWKETRCTTGQFKLIKELSKRQATLLSSSRMTNEEGIEIEGERTYEVHDCAILSDKAIRQMSAKFASAYIQQLDKEIAELKRIDSKYELTDVEQNEKRSERESLVELVFHHKRDMDNTRDEMEAMIARLYACVGQDVDEDTAHSICDGVVGMEEVETKIVGDNKVTYIKPNPQTEKLYELMRFVALILGKTQDTVENIAEICSFFFTKERVEAILATQA